MTRYRLKSERLYSAPVGDDVVYLDQVTGQYLAVNSTGACLCARLAAGPASRADLEQALQTTFEVDATTAATDAGEFRAHLEARDLVQVIQP